MKVHHLNCGTMDPPATAQMVCHVLLIETDNGLALVDTGFGSHDCAYPARRHARFHGRGQGSEDGRPGSTIVSAVFR